MVKKTNKPFFFDVEAGGLRGAESQLFSVGFGTDRDDVSSSHAGRKSGVFTSIWSEENVWKPIEAQAAAGKIKLGSEKDLIRSFITQLNQAAEQGVSTLTGWNIGYDIRDQFHATHGYDIPMSLTRASVYGLQNELSTAFKRFSIRDLGQEYAVRMSQELASYGHLVEKGLLDADFYAQSQAYLKDAPTGSVEEIARHMAMSGKRISGWKQQIIGEELMGLSFQAHVVEADVQAGLDLWMKQGQKLFTSEADVVRWNRKAFENSLINQAIWAPREGVTAVGRYEGLVARAAALESSGHEMYKGLASSFEENLSKVVSSRGGDLSLVKQGLGMGTEKMARIATPSVLSRIKVGRKPLAIAAGAIALWALEAGSWFSGKDDAYNTIEGLAHGGMAEQKRKAMTDFGSGFKGRYIMGAGAAVLGTIGAIGGAMGAWKDQKGEDEGSFLGAVAKGAALFAGISAATIALPAMGMGIAARNMAKKLGQDGMANKAGWSVFKAQAKTGIAALRAMPRTMWQVQTNKQVIGDMKKAAGELTGIEASKFGRALLAPAKFFGKKLEGAVEHTSHWLGENWLPKLKKGDPASLLLAGLSVVDAYHAGAAAYEGDVGGVAGNVVKFAGMKYAYMGWHYKKPIMDWAKKQKKADIISYASAGLNMMGSARTAAIEGLQYYASYVRTGVGVIDYGKIVAETYGENFVRAGRQAKSAWADAGAMLGPELREKFLNNKVVKTVVTKSRQAKQKAAEAAARGDKLTKEQFEKNWAAGESSRDQIVEDVSSKTWIGEKAATAVRDANVNKLWGLFESGRGIARKIHEKTKDRETIEDVVSGLQSNKALNAIPGFDDAYNKIEGLRHGGIAEILRKEGSDFGSGWIRKALSRGMSFEKVAAAHFKLSGEKGFERLATEAMRAGIDHQRILTQGWLFGNKAASGASRLVKLNNTRRELFAVGSELGAGGFGKAFNVMSVSNGRKGVLKEALDLESLRQSYSTSSETQLIPRTTSRLIRQFKRTKWKGVPHVIEDVGMEGYSLSAFKQQVSLTVEATPEIRGLASRYYNPLHFEASMQKKAWQSDPNRVAEVFGTTERGFIQEYAGRQLDPTEYRKGAAFLRKVADDTIAGKIQIAHLDPDVSNMLISETGQIKLIDYGVSTSSGAMTSSEVQLRGFKSLMETSAEKLERYAVDVQASARSMDIDSIRSQARKLRQADLQKTGVRQITEAGNNPGSGEASRRGLL